MHESCKLGCLNGMDYGYAIGCSDADVCEKKKTSEKDSFCSSTCNRMKNKQPKPTIYDTCKRACYDSTQNGCELGLEKIQEIVVNQKRSIWRALKGEEM